jgi:serine/threonine protein kinase
MQIKTDDAFALKELIKQPNMEQNQSDREFWQEVDSLKRFSGFIHPHLVTLLMTWTIQNSYYLLFPWADCDLDHFLNRKRVGRDPQTGLMDLSMLQWISKQILGMASALNSIHNPRPGFLSTEGQKYGRHGDLKPENILWYQSDEDSQGILVIADLGLSTLNSILTRSGISNGKIPGTPRYRPPEYDIKGGHISRSYDIWTFGCLLLEIVCWALNGPEGRKAFADRRESCYVTGCVSDMFFGVERHLEGYFVMKVKDQVSQVNLSIR